MWLGSMSSPNAGEVIASSTWSEGRRVVDGMADVRLDTERHAIVLRAVRQPAERVDDLIERRGIVSCASLARS